MDLLQARSGEVQEDLLKIQIHEYMGFINKFAEETNIMTKHFFIVIPYLPAQSGAQKEAGKLLSFGLAHTSQGGEDASFDAARIQLEQRVATVMQGLLRFGLRSQKLGTEEVVELFYKLFNPGEQDRDAPKVVQRCSTKITYGNI
jgi:hypothetical protein